ncbi:conserved Plasmodium protein, unknown function [Plasmodium gallinaceum]|uniref:Uncharacterized protein n=1 Tax=Plasmodium gallinaceum TaxID=5849 RepID=A0A1J1GYY4_PLAGA|nr:conserved Plasmodium protein, unknown function [Plasmodium gallinaceum]CRG96227.1 conserved Plasmodium protein, unknown function [Plasmodium gallinaceum]
MGETKNKFEIARNRSSNSIRENLLHSSDILKTSNNLLKNSLFEVNDKKNYVDHTFNKREATNINNLININDSLNKHYSLNDEGITYSDSVNHNLLNKEFSNSMFYDKIMMSNKTYNSAVDNLQNNFRGNNLTNVVNSIKFEENVNIKIPSILKSSPLYVLYPELNNLREKEEEEEEENTQKKDGIENCNENEFLRDINDKKKLSNYLKDDLINNTLMKNKMYDYFELEKKNLVQIEGPNELNYKLLCSKSNEASNVILNCYKNRHVTNNNNHTYNELNTLNFLKKQKMPIVEKNERENFIIHSTSPRKKNILKKYEENDEEKIIKKKEKEFFISLIDTSNKTATVKTFDIKSNKEVKENKNILQIKKKPLKDVEVQTNEEELKKSSINVIDPYIENVYNILYKKKSELQKKKDKNNNKFKNVNNNDTKQELLTNEKEKSENLKHKISYNMIKQSDKSDVSNNDNNSDSYSEKSSNNSNSNDSNKSSIDTTEEDDKENKKKMNIKQHITHSNDFMKFGVPYNILNTIYNKNSPFYKNPFVNIDTSNSLKAGKVLNMNILNMDKNEKSFNSKDIIKKNHLIKNFSPILNPLKIPYIPQYIQWMKSNMNTFPPKNKNDLYHNNLNHAYMSYIFPVSNQLKKTSLNKGFLPLMVNKSIPSFLKGKRELANKKKLCKLTKNKGLQKINESDDSILSEENETNEEIKSENEYEKSKIINNLLLKKLYINKEKELYEKKKFQETFWSFLENNDMLKERTRGKFNSLRNTYYHYNDGEKDNSLFLRKYRCWEEHYNKNIKNMKKYFLDNNYNTYEKGFNNIKCYSHNTQSNEINNLDPKKRNYSQPTYNENHINKAQQFVNFNNTHNLYTFKEENNDYLKENKKKEFKNKKIFSQINLNKKFALLENMNRNNKNILSKLKNKNSNNFTPHPIKEEVYNSSLKFDNQKRCRSFSYKNRLQKLNLLSKSIAPIKEVVKKNNNILTKKNNEETHFNGNENELKMEVENHRDIQKVNWELNEQKNNDKKNYQKILNDIKFSYNKKNTLKENYNSEEKCHIKNKISIEKITNDIPNESYNFYNDSHKYIEEKEIFNLKSYENSLKDIYKLNNVNENFSYGEVITKEEDCIIGGESEKKEENTQKNILNNNKESNDHLMTYKTKTKLNKTDNLLRIKVNLKRPNNETIIPNMFIKDENKKNDDFDHSVSQYLDKNYENVEKNEKHTRETIGNQKCVNINLLDETKGNFNNMETVNKIKEPENQINNIACRKVSNAKNFLRKNNGSGGGNYVKIKERNISNHKNCKPLITLESNILNKNTKNNADFNLKSSSVSNGNATKLNEMINLENIDPNKWIEEIFGDS